MSGILLTGANGFLGRRIKAQLPVMEAPSLRNAARDDVMRLLDETEPDVIVHTAAISDIGVCEKNPEASWQANVQLPVLLASAAQGCKLVMFSTDQVYSASPEDGPYTEDQTCPGNTYARHKLEMEQRVLDIAPDAVMLRATWMYDMPIHGAANRGNFLMNVLRAAQTGEGIAFPSQQQRGITYAREVARRLEAAITLPGGVYNFGSENPLSVYETARFLIDVLGLKAELSDAPARHHLWMNCSKLRQQGIAFDTTAEGLLKCIDDYSLR